METETKTITMEELQAMMSKTSKEAITPILATLSDFEGKLKAVYTVDKGPAKVAEIVMAKDVATKEAPVAKVEDVGLAKMEIMGIPVGQAVVGGFVAVLATELVDGVFAKQQAYVRGAVKLGAAFAVVKWGKKIPFVGEGGAKAIALLVTFDAVRDFLPIDQYAQKIAAKVSGTVANAGLAGPKMFNTLKVGRGDYYSRMSGN